jgi:hypothetical protein
MTKKGSLLGLLAKLRSSLEYLEYCGSFVDIRELLLG